VPSLLIRNIGAMVSGDVAQPLAEADSLYAEDGRIVEVGTNHTDADTVVDACGLTLTPGLVDGHSHPTFGDYSPTQDSVGWMRTYLHGGVTTIVSAGELHLPGLNLEQVDPTTFRYLAGSTVAARKISAAAG
jgi:enamidase